MRRFLRKYFIALYRRGRPIDAAGDPLALPRGFVVGSLGAAVVATAISYWLINGVLTSLLDDALADGVTLESLDPRHLDESRGCAQALAGDGNASREFACALAFAASDRFSSLEAADEPGGQTQSPRRSYVVRALSAALSSNSGVLDAAVLTQFLRNLCGGPGFPPHEDVRIEIVFRVTPRLSCSTASTEPDVDIGIATANVLAFVRGSTSPLEQPRAGFSGAARAAMGFQTVSPPATPSQRFLRLGSVLPGYRQREAFQEVSLLFDGLVGLLQDAAFVPMRSIQALNGGIQWLTVLAGWWCGILLLIRREWLATQAAMVEDEESWRIDPLLSERPWPTVLRSTDADELLKRLHGAAWTLPGRLLRDLNSRGNRDAATVASVTSEYIEQGDAAHFSLVRWLLEAIPTLGFVGTIYGMILAMGGAGDVVGVQDQQALKVGMAQLSRNLGTAFDTTLVGLLLSIVLGRFYGAVQGRQAALLLRLRERATEPVEDGRAA